MAFGLTRAPFLAYISGCALGIIPKTVLVCLFSSTFESLSKGGGLMTAGVMLMLSLIWLGLVLFVQKMLKNKAN
jgi:uncharacterized membrane protein YdjX (TVP38/TMEM64 family)